MKKAANRKRPAVNKVYYIYVGILAVLFFIFHTIPFLKGVFYSFTDWRGYGDWNFVGLRNYLHMFVDADIPCPRTRDGDSSELLKRRSKEVGQL